MTETLRRIVQSSRFHYGVLALIVLAAILIGLETDNDISERYIEYIELLNQVILWAFVVEALMKMGQHGRYFYRYFEDPWNIFDFAIIAVCFLPIHAQYAAILRLARVFRALRLVTALPKLQLLVNALIKSIPSMFYVGLLLFLLFYLYGVMAVFLFRPNDPVHFHNLPTSMLTLFRVVTQEDWTDVMYIQMYGSNVYPYVNTTDIEPVPSARPVLGALFFVSFVFLGTMIMLNLFIGVIINSMQEAQQDKVRADLGQSEKRVISTEEALALITERLESLDDRVRNLHEQLLAERT